MKEKMLPPTVPSLVKFPTFLWLGVLFPPWGAPKRIALAPPHLQKVLRAPRCLHLPAMCAVCVFHVSEADQHDLDSWQLAAANWHLDLPFGYDSHSHGKSPFLSSVNRLFLWAIYTMAMLVISNKIDPNSKHTKNSGKSMKITLFNR